MKILEFLFPFQTDILVDFEIGTRETETEGGRKFNNASRRRRRVVLIFFFAPARKSANKKNGGRLT